MEHQKIIGLKLHNDKFDTNLALNVESTKGIYWWINNIIESFAPLNIPDPDIIIYTDTSLTGWGITDGKTPSGGRWDENEITHRNVLELKAIHFGGSTYSKDKNFKHIGIMSDNSTAISYINKKGGQKSHDCNKIAKETWIWCISRDLHKSVAHTPGKDNFQADKILENFKMQLNGCCIQKHTKMYVTPLVHQKSTYLPLGSTEKLKNMSPGNQNQKLLQLMLFL